MGPLPTGLELRVGLTQVQGVESFKTFSLRSNHVRGVDVRGETYNRRRRNRGCGISFADRITSEVSHGSMEGGAGWYNVFLFDSGLDPPTKGSQRTSHRHNFVDSTPTRHVGTGLTPAVDEGSDPCVSLQVLSCVTNQFSGPVRISGTVPGKGDQSHRDDILSN